MRYVGQGQRWRVGTEYPNHGKPAFERSDELAGLDGTLDTRWTPSYAEFDKRT